MPDAVRTFRRDNMAGRTFIISRIWDSLFFENSPNGRRPQVQARSAEGVGDSDLSHGGAQGFESLNKVADKIGTPVDRPGKLKQSGRSALIEAADQKAMVAAVTRKVSAACLSDQPREARSSRMAIRSGGP